MNTLTYMYVPKIMYHHMVLIYQYYENMKSYIDSKCMTYPTQI